jgi:hypothetical protein
VSFPGREAYSGSSITEKFWEELIACLPSITIYEYLRQAEKSQCDEINKTI